MAPEDSQQLPPRRRARAWCLAVTPALIIVLLVLGHGLPAVLAAAYNWLQFGGSAQHDGNNRQETAITPGNVAMLQQLYRVELTTGNPQDTPTNIDGSLVFVHDVSTEHGTKDLLIGDRKDGMLIAFDAATGLPIWSHATLPAGCTHPESGEACHTTSSAAIDPNGQYVYAYGLDGYVHRYDVGDGTEVTGGGWPELATTKPTEEKSAGALTIAASGDTTYLYAVNGGYPGDGGDYQGHVTTINLSDGSQHVFNALCSNLTVHFDIDTKSGGTDCADKQGAIWARGGVDFDPDTNEVYFTTGNANYTGNAGGFDWGDTVLALHPDGTGDGNGNPLDSYTPSNFSQLQQNDADLGSTAPAILPLPAGCTSHHYGLQSGKDSELRVLNLDDLSGQGGPGHTGGELAMAALPQGGIMKSQIATWADPAGNIWSFVASGNGIAAYEWSFSNCRLSQPQSDVSNAKWHVGGSGASSPVIANGVLFYAVTGAMEALDPSTGTVLWKDSNLAGITPVQNIHWETPIVVDGVVYITDGVSDHHDAGETDGHLLAYGLTGQPSATATTTDTVTPNSSATDSATPAPTNTPSDTRTATSTPGDTRTATSTATMTTTPTGTATQDPADTNTTTPGATITPGDSRTATGTATATSTQSRTNTPTVTVTATGTSTDTLTVTATGTGTPTGTASPTATALESSTRTATGTPTATVTATATGTPSPTSTLTDGGTLTVTPTGSPAATATAADPAPADPPPPGCKLVLLPNPQTVQQGGSESVLIELNPGDQVVLTVASNDPTWPGTQVKARQNGNIALTGNYTPSTGGDAGRWSYSATAGPNGRLLVTFPVPASEPVGSYALGATSDGAGCRVTTHPGDAGKLPIEIMRVASFSIEVPAVSSFGLDVLPAHRSILLRSVEPSPHSDALASENVYIQTAPGATITLNARIYGKTVASLGTAADLLAGQITPAGYATGAPFANGDSFFSQTVTAPHTGAHGDGKVRIAIPITSQLLTPNHAGNVKLYVTARTGSDPSTKPVTYASGFIALKEAGLRLLVQPKESTRGDKRALFELGHGKANTAQNNPGHDPLFDTSQLAVLVLADQGAHVSGSVTFGDPAQGGFTGTATGTGGALSGRVTLRFHVPNDVLPSSGLATLTVTSTFRGSTIARTVRLGYGVKP